VRRFLFPPLDDWNIIKLKKSKMKREDEQISSVETKVGIWGAKLRRDVNFEENTKEFPLTMSILKRDVGLKKMDILSKRPNAIPYLRTIEWVYREVNHSSKHARRTHGALRISKHIPQGLRLPS